MLTYIKITNFRSIKDEVEFNLSSKSQGNHLINNLYKSDDMDVYTKRSVGLYGANASGKSNVLMAFEAIRYITAISGDLKDGEEIDCYEPYALSKFNTKAPTSFEVEFYSKNGNKFLYKIEFIQNEILFESLDYYPSRTKANIFFRKENDTWETIKFGSHYKGGMKKIPFFKNNSYLSKAGNNAASPQIIKEVYNFFKQDITHIGLNEKLSISRFGDIDKTVKETAKILSIIDTGVDDISVKKIKTEDIESKLKDIPEEIRNVFMEDIRNRYMFSHKSEEGKNVIFSILRESEGTQKLFHMIPLISYALKNKKILVIDELESSLHPYIADLIISLFNDKNVNIHGSQLIFSTHNVNIMSPEKMRRDQIFFCEKINKSTSLYSLDEFDKKEVTTKTNYANWYEEGRFGAVPKLNYLKIAKLFSSKENSDDVKLSKEEIDRILNDYS